MRPHVVGTLLLALASCSKEVDRLPAPAAQARTTPTSTTPTNAQPTNTTSSGQAHRTAVEGTPVPAPDVKPLPAIEATVTDASGVRGIKIGGVEIVCAEDLPVRENRTPAPEQTEGTATLLVLRGHSIRITGEVLEIDAVRFGAVHAGDKVELRKAGVFVNATSVGPLP